MIKVQATVVIPTYNEALNISELLTELKKYDVSVVVVDDSSPDGTADIVAKHDNTNVHLLKRGKKQGLGKAYIDGFGYALEELGADVVIEMDGDLSHDPGDIPRLLDEINEGFDFVIGSRHVKDGAIPHWGPHRRIISYVGNQLARIILGLRVSDCTSGYRAIKTTALRKILTEKINVKGYAFQMSLLYYAVLEDAKIKEIPIVFHRRKAGESKLGVADIAEFLAELIRLRIE